MNKLWLIFILGLSCPVFGQKESLRFLHGNICGFIKKSGTSLFYPHEIAVIVDLEGSRTNVELLFLDKNNTTNRFFITLNSKQRQEAFEAIAKYKEWHDTALTNKYKLDKLITQAESSLITWRKSSGNIVFSQSNVSFKFVFFSQNPKNHQFVFLFPIIRDKKEKASIKPPPIYFNYKEAIALANLFSDKTLSEAISREKQKNQVFQ